MAKLDVQYVIDVPRSARNGGALIVSGGGGGGSLPDFSLYMKRDGSTSMLGNLDMGGFSVTNVSLLDGVDLSAHVLDPNAHHNQIHGMITSNHTIVGAAFQIVGATSANVLGLITPLSDASGATKEAILKTDSSGFLSLVKLTATNSVRTPLIDTATEHLTLSPAGDLLLNPGSALTKIFAAHAIQTNGFTSGWTGYGFRLDQDISRANKAHLEIDDLVVRGRMSVYELLIRQIRATNGSIFITSTARIKNVSSISGGYHLSTIAAGETTTTELSHGFLVGDLIRSQRTKWNGSSVTGVYQSDLQVTAVTNLYEFDVSLISGDVPAIGMEYVRLGSASDVDRRGSIYMTADDTNAPFIDVVDGISLHSLWNSSGAVKVRIGKLTGITGQSNTYGIFSGNSAATWQSMDTLNGFRIGYAGTTRFRVDISGNLNIYNTSSVPIITLASDGTSYFSGVMTIGASGEIRQGTGTFGTNWTGLRIWNDTGKGRIAGYNSSNLQWYADTNGELRAGGGVVGLSADGLSLTRYITTGIGEPVAGTESSATIAWWDDINSRSSTDPIARIYASRNITGVGGVPSLIFEIDQLNADVNKRPSIWLSSGGASNAPELWFQNVYSIIGIPGIFPQRTFGTANTRVDFSGSLYFGAHILRLPATADIDIGTSGNPFRTLYVQNIIATATSGAAISGSIWQNDAADMYIRSSSASNRTLYIANPSTGSMSLDVEMNITLGGTVDGVDIANFYTAYQGHSHGHSALTGVTADQHHAQTHVLATNTGLGPYQTMSGATAGHVLRASSAVAANFQALSHDDLTGVTADQHHSQIHGLITSNHTVSGSEWQIVGLPSANTLGLLTPLSDVSGATKEAILKSNSIGQLTLASVISTSGNIYSNNPISTLTLAGQYQTIKAASITLSNGGIYSTTAVSFFNGSSQAMQIHTGSVLVSSNYAHSTLVPTNGIYSLGAIRTDVKISVPLVDTVSGHLSLQPAGDLSLNPVSGFVKAQSGINLQAFNYASQTTAWRITSDGQGDFRYLFTDEMHAKSFIADLEQALAGGQIISKSVAILAVQNFVAPAAGDWNYLYVEDLPSAANMAVFESGDTIGIRKFSRSGGSLTISWCWGVVTAYVDGNGTNFAEKTQRWTFTRSAAPNAGAMATSTVVEMGAIILDFGVSGNGYYEVNAIDGLRAVNSPYAQIVSWTGHPASGVTRTRFGNLYGLSLTPQIANEYGLYAGNGTGNDNAWLRISNQVVKLNNMPFEMSTGGVVKVSLAAWNDIWIGPSSADKRLTWNGSLLTVKGAIVITSASTGYANLDIPAFLEEPVGGTAGLHMTATKFGYYDGSVWKMWMNNAGNFFFGGDTGARLQWNGTKLAGYNSSNEEQWSANSTDGKLKAGVEGVWIDRNGVSLTSATSYSIQNSLSWTTVDRSVINSEIYGSYFPGPEGGRVRNRLNIRTNNVTYGGATRIDGEVYITATKLGGGYSAIELSADYLRFNGYNVWHSALSGDFRSNATINFRDLTGAATNITANSVTTFSGYLQSDTTITALNNAASAYQIIMASAFHPTTGYIRSDNNIILTNLSGSSYQQLYASNGIFSGTGSFGQYAVIGTSVSGGFYQDANNGAYRALSNTGNKGFYFQNFGGSTTPMFVGLVGTYAGQVGIGTVTPTSGFALDVNGAAYFRSSVVLGGQTRIESIGYLTSAPTINSGEVRMYVTTGATGGLRFMIAHNHSGTIKYRWLDLDGTAAIWNYSGSWADVLS